MHIPAGDEAEQQQALLQQQQQRQQQQQELVHLETELQYNEVCQRHSALPITLIVVQLSCVPGGCSLLATEAWGRG